MFLAGLGHNGGSPLDPDPDDLHASWRLFTWKRAVKRVWNRPERETAVQRLARAEARGMTYRQHTLEIMEHGVYLWA